MSGTMFGVLRTRSITARAFGPRSIMSPITYKVSSRPKSTFSSIFSNAWMQPWMSEMTSRLPWDRACSFSGVSMNVSCQ